MHEIVAALVGKQPLLQCNRPVLLADIWMVALRHFRLSALHEYDRQSATISASYRYEDGK